MTDGVTEVNGQPLSEFTILYVVYERPKDYPEEFVIRRQFIGRNSQQFFAKRLYARGGTLESVRAVLPGGLYNLGRMESDDPVIREVWI